MSEPSSYPNAFCVKCGTHTDTLKKHTVLLANSSRALKGVCGACESEVYKILPKIRAAKVRMPLTAEEKKQYPDAFCLKCQDHTPTRKAHTVMLENNSRAVTGECAKCGEDVYRILQRGDASSAQAMATTVMAPEAPRANTVTRAPINAVTRIDAKTTTLKLEPKQPTQRIDARQATQAKQPTLRIEAKQATIGLAKQPTMKIDRSTIKLDVKRSRLGLEGPRAATMKLDVKESSVKVDKNGTMKGFFKATLKVDPRAAMHDRRIILSRSAEKAKTSWSFYAATGMIVGIVAAFFAYAVLS